ncbi:WLM domain-containing protein [Thelonectria olida]|uniref:WLM domain-containing protein n=1 Tax=Thelonectria olida TaxID=1576542 RepID=A0A9P8WG54_9HYPO|nr:WLM domain-containing protein [Thelonectria olida]
MVAGWQRLNEKKSQPNPNIVFIKPLKGPDQKIAQDFLERIAAQCRPIMREHHLYVTSLEEYEPNREFVGRNFNAGEVVQLVLKSPSTGRWLPFDYVQMVMMHELAHCKQMSHSRAFWAVRDSYASEMHQLWSKGYIGDGLWGRGANLATGEWEKNTVRADEVLPEHLCGGTFRSRRRKRKAKPSLTYKERKERRILKKFGENGMTLGADEETKVKLEGGKKVQAKPRVAGSARGRELRAAAALARFDKQKEETPPPKEEDVETESGSESEYEDDGAIGPDSKDAVDLDGSRLVDGQGRGMVKVCEDEDVKEPSAMSEAQELQDMFRRIKRESPEISALGSLKEVEEKSNAKLKAKGPAANGPSVRVKPEPSDGPSGIGSSRVSATGIGSFIKTEEDAQQQSTSCSMCSFSNEKAAPTCAMCANVLNPSISTRAWQCQSDSCRNTSYRNADDCGVCGLCGRKRRGDV